jgi:hypothetical protein
MCVSNIYVLFVYRGSSCEIHFLFQLFWQAMPSLTVTDLPFNSTQTSDRISVKELSKEIPRSKSGSLKGLEKKAGNKPLAVMLR